MNRCEHFERLISDSLDRALTGAEQLELDAHLATCDACTAFSRQLSEYRAELQSLPLETAHRSSPLPQATSDNFITRFWHTRLTVPLPVAAGILLMLLSAVLVSSLVGGGEEPAVEPAPQVQTSYVQIEVVSPATARPLVIDAPKDGD